MTEPPSRVGAPCKQELQLSSHTTPLGVPHRRGLQSVAWGVTDRPLRHLCSAYWCSFVFFRLNTKSLERASMDYEAPLMPCGCILLLPLLHTLGSGAQGKGEALVATLRA